MSLECESAVNRRWFSKKEESFEQKSVSPGSSENITNGNIRVTGLVNIDDTQAAVIFVNPRRYKGVLYEDMDDEVGKPLDLKEKVAIRGGQEIILTEKTLFKVRQVSLAFEPSENKPEPEVPVEDHGTHLPALV